MFLKASNKKASKENRKTEHLVSMMMANQFTQKLF